MTTNREILTLAQWLSPAFPVGAFAYSHGLEAAVQAGWVASGADLAEWLEDVIAHGSGRNDCILLRAAHDADGSQDLAKVNAMAKAIAASAERQLEQALQGAAFCKTTGAIWRGEGAEYLYPVAVGAAAAKLRIDVALTAAMYLHAITSNLISAAQRLMPLGQTEGQAVLAALSPLCEETAKAAMALTCDDLQSTAFLSDIAAMRHETQQPRIFRS
ncbi:urease accessory protein UreF [Loktanella sp. 5RATIMAR09]|uniref:urease accessory protein UreF n=1 Tax=Loktanella sp. 5RATIMAR09 TaxID=1225655 RepID=UPI0006EB8205|nr:urease accessory protein UreF [Loktanella sp. 5RATIMAR09]KQI70818.1 urease accessory protein UreF [Loktanella sp. 5RATIMAR09]